MPGSHYLERRRVKRRLAQRVQMPHRAVAVAYFHIGTLPDGFRKIGFSRLHGRFKSFALAQECGNGRRQGTARAKHAVEAEVRLYDRLWKVENPRDDMAAIREAKNCDAVTAMKEIINPDSLHIIKKCYIEPYAADMKPLTYLQFQRIGYFTPDTDSTAEKPIFNKTVGLKDTWKK